VIKFDNNGFKAVRICSPLYLYDQKYTALNKEQGLEKRVRKNEEKR
jgi:hypothetical protein